LDGSPGRWQTKMAIFFDIAGNFGFMRIWHACFGFF